MPKSYRRVIEKPNFPHYIENPIRGITVDDILHTNDAANLISLLDQVKNFVLYSCELMEDWVGQVNAKSVRINALGEEVNRMGQGNVWERCEKSINDKVARVNAGNWSLFEPGLEGSGLHDTDSLTSPTTAIAEGHQIYPLSQAAEAAHFTKASENISWSRIYEYECQPPPAIHLFDAFREDGNVSIKFYSYPDFFFDEWKKLMVATAESRKSKGAARSGGGGKKRAEGNNKKRSGSTSLGGKSAAPKGIAIRKYSREGQFSIMQVQASVKGASAESSPTSPTNMPSSTSASGGLDRIAEDGADNDSNKRFSRPANPIPIIPPAPISPPSPGVKASSSQDSFVNRKMIPMGSSPNAGLMSALHQELASRGSSASVSRSPTMDKNISQMMMAGGDQQRQQSSRSSTIEGNFGNLSLKTSLSLGGGVSFIPPPPPAAPALSPLASPVQEPSATAKAIAAVQLKKVTVTARPAAPDDPRDSLLSAIRNRENLNLKKVQVTERDALGRPVKSSAGDLTGNKETLTGSAGPIAPANNSVAAILMRRAAMEASDDSSSEGSEDNSEWN